MSDKRKTAFEVKWRIENITPWLQTKDDSLYSPQFLAKTCMSTRWKLRLSRKWRLDENGISLTVQRDLDEHSEMIALNYELSFLAGNGSPLKSKSSTSKFSAKTVSQELHVAGVEILKEKKEAYFPEGVLTVCCKLWMPRSSISKGGQCSIRSVIGTKCVTLDSIIDNFQSLNMYSVNFISPSSEISLISFDVSLNQNNYLTFKRTEVECKCFSFSSSKLFALDARGTTIDYFKPIDQGSLLTSHTSCVFQSGNSYRCLINSGRLKNDTLALQLEITYFPGIVSECIEYDDKNYKKLTDESVDLVKEKINNSEDIRPNPLSCLQSSGYEETTLYTEKNESSDEDECFDAAGKMNLPSTTLKEDLTSLYNDMLFCDTKLRTETETFPAHRNVLSARSPVFRKMFTTDMKEKAGECINIPDISSDTVCRMLQFLYTDYTGDLDMQSAKDLYIAADKYDLASLKQRCSSFMKKNLCPANVCEVLTLADMHQDKNLESDVQEYVLINDEEVFNSGEWKLFMKNYGSLAAQVMYLKFTRK